MRVFKGYWLLIKPKQTFLLAYTGICSMLAANPRVAPLTFFVVLSSLILSIAGATALTNYVDRDIDAIMKRTSRRPLPSRMIDPPQELFTSEYF